MPYIEKDKRPPVDKLVDPLMEYIKSQPLEEQDGDFNYVITKLIRGIYPMKYFHQNRAVGAVFCALLEHYGAKIRPYEDQKIKDNGDVG